MKLKYQKKEDVPEELIQYYVESGDKWILEAAQELISENAEITKSYGALQAMTRIEQAAIRAVSEIAVPRKGSLDLILNRAVKTFTVNSDGEFRALDEDGVPIFDKQGKKLNMRSWALDTLDEADYLFEPDETRKKSNEPAPAKKPAGTTISKSVVDGKSLQSDVLEAIANGSQTVV